MEVRIEVLYDEFSPDGYRDRDKIFRAIDEVLDGATWEQYGEGFRALR